MVVSLTKLQPNNRRVRHPRRSMLLFSIFSLQLVPSHLMTESPFLTVLIYLPALFKDDAEDRRSPEKAEWKKKQILYFALFPYQMTLSILQGEQIDLSALIAALSLKYLGPCKTQIRTFTPFWSNLPWKQNEDNILKVSPHQLIYYWPLGNWGFRASSSLNEGTDNGWLKPSD